VAADASVVLDVYLRSPVETADEFLGKAVFALADRISVLVYGRILVSGTPEEIRGNEEVRAIYLGDEEIGA